jgi:hypothetical protein
MTAASLLYSVDTSALIDGLERYYPAETFPALWERVDELVSAGRFFISEEVWEEAQVRAAAVQQWCDGRKDRIVIPTDAAIIQEVQRILASYQRLVMNMKGRNRADPFVIGLARVRGAVVVTGEGSDGTADRPKIPYICQQMGIRCVRFLDVVRLEGWKFE